MRRAPHPGDAYFASIGDRLGANYLRYSFTKGTRQEVDFLVALLDLPKNARILDVGCGPGRHALALIERGFMVTGIDVSKRFLEIARDRGNELGLGSRLSLFECDARQMPFDDEFDAVISICEGAFGLMGADDGLVLRRMFEAARPGGRLVLTAMNAFVAATVDNPDAALDPETGTVHERTKIVPEGGSEEEIEAWTSVYTPRELRLLAIGTGFVPEHVWSVEPGSFAKRAPDLERPELMLVARKPG